MKIVLRGLGRSLAVTLLFGASIWGFIQILADNTMDWPLRFLYILLVPLIAHGALMLAWDAGQDRGA